MPLSLTICCVPVSFGGSWPERFYYKMLTPHYIEQMTHHLLSKVSRREFAHNALVACFWTQWNWICKRKSTRDAALLLEKKFEWWMHFLCVSSSRKISCRSSILYLSPAAHGEVFDEVDHCKAMLEERYHRKLRVIMIDCCDEKSVSYVRAKLTIGAW